MIQYADVTAGQELHDAAVAYEQAYGGRFVGDELVPASCTWTPMGRLTDLLMITSKRNC